MKAPKRVVRADLQAGVRVKVFAETLKVKVISGAWTVSSKRLRGRSGRGIGDKEFDVGCWRCVICRKGVIGDCWAGRT